MSPPPNTQKKEKKTYRHFMAKPSYYYSPYIHIVMLVNKYDMNVP